VALRRDLTWFVICPLLFLSRKLKGKTVTLTPLLQAVAFSVLLVTLAGCASSPVPDTELDAVLDSEINLHLPIDEPEDFSCECVAAPSENYFDRGVRALAARDYPQAKIYFEEHRLSAGEGADREADVGLAFVALLSVEVSESHPAYSASGIDERAEVMTLALAAVTVLEDRLKALTALNEALSTDLERREDALKRLRDLTLGLSED